MPDNKQGSSRGFGSMDEDKQREIASEGGKASGGNFANDRERAAEAGRKGGQQSAEDRSGGPGESRGSRRSDPGSGAGRGSSGQQQAGTGNDRQQESGSGSSRKESDRESRPESDRRGGRP